MKITHFDTSNIPDDASLDQWLKLLPAEMHARAFRYRFRKDALNYIFGRLLIKEGLEERGMDEKIEEIKFTEKGKPFLPEIEFNISHSGTLVACIFSENGAVGIDVEKIKPIDLNDFNRFFMPHEMQDIRQAKNSLERFYFYWTRKESIIKALGVDLSYLHRISIDPTKDYFLVEGKKWSLQTVEFNEEYLGAVCGV